MSFAVPFTAPEFRLAEFNCAFCHAYAHQEWGQPFLIAEGTQLGEQTNFWTARCRRCKKISVWIDTRMVHPWKFPVAFPNPDLPEEIAGDYLEAGVIVGRSPRGASAILRLAIQKLCMHLNASGHDINRQIADLVKKGLPPQIQQALDIVRVVGNNAVHPGQIDLKDDIETAGKLFGLVNLIAEVMITQPKHVSSLYEEIVPEADRERIKKRDANPETKKGA